MPHTCACVWDCACKHKAWRVVGKIDLQSVQWVERAGVAGKGHHEKEKVLSILHMLRVPYLYQWVF